jgi:hypothetical protein
MFLYRDPRRRFAGHGPLISFVSAIVRSAWKKNENIELKVYQQHF